LVSEAFTAMRAMLVHGAKQQLIWWCWLWLMMVRMPQTKERCGLLLTPKAGWCVLMIAVRQ
jgi:hypothetical protein